MSFNLEQLQADIEQIETAINYVSEIQSKYFEEEKEDIYNSLTSLKCLIESEIQGIEKFESEQFEKEFPQYRNCEL